MKNLSIGRCAAGAVALALAGSATAQTPQPAASLKVDSETISGLGARNIGSAAMSGRVAAVDAVWEGQRLTVYGGAASGGGWKAGHRGDPLIARVVKPAMPAHVSSCTHA